MSREKVNQNGSPFISAFCRPLLLAFILILCLPQTGLSGASARAELEEESFQSISGVINRVVANTESDIKVLELHCQLIGSKNQRSESNAELASKINREMIQTMARSLSARHDFQNALRALQGVKVKFKKK